MHSLSTAQTGSGLQAAPGSEGTTLFQVRASLPQPLRDAVRSGSQLASDNETGADVSALSTTVAAFDELTIGGLPRGHLVELTGKRSSGRFSTVLAALSATTRSGEVAVLVDLGDNLELRSAEESGVDLERLLWIRPSCIKEAMISTEIVLQAGFPLVTLDLGTPPLRGGRGAEAHWLRLARTASAQRSALLVSSPYRISSTAATAVLAAERCRPLWYRNGRAPSLLDGFDGRLLLRKSRLPSGSSAGGFRFTTTPQRASTTAQLRQHRSAAAV